jgi:hypothetical protein
VAIDLVKEIGLNHFVGQKQFDKASINSPSVVLYGSEH